MQQVGAKAFADAQLVDPRHLPVPLAEISRRTRIGFGRAWVLHRKLIVRGTAALIVAVTAAGLYQGRHEVLRGADAIAGVAQGQFARAGFGISAINISGQSLTSEGTILKALAVTPGSSTLDFDADAALRRLEAIPTIKSASIRKIYPGQLAVSVVEKVPMARWRIGDATYVVDDEGSPVVKDDGSFARLPLVVGEGAADDALVMIKALGAYPAIKEGLAALSRIGDRRWDLIFYSGLRVQLPETGVAQALQRLDMYEREDKLLDRDVDVIDMRVPGLLSLKLGDLAEKAWADFKKHNKHAKSKGDAEYETAAERAAEARGQ